MHSFRNVGCLPWGWGARDADLSPWAFTLMDLGLLIALTRMTVGQCRWSRWRLTCSNGVVGGDLLVPEQRTLWPGILASGIAPACLG